MAKIDSIEAEVRSKVQEAVDEFVQNAKALEGSTELSSDIVAVEIRIIGQLQSKSSVGIPIVSGRRDIKP